MESPAKADENESNSEKSVAKDEKDESESGENLTERAATPDLNDTDTSTETKPDPTDGKAETSVSDKPGKSSDNEDNLIDVEDSDDYLLHLESILKTIHARFYEYYEEHQKVTNIHWTLSAEVISNHSRFLFCSVNRFLTLRFWYQRFAAKFWLAKRSYSPAWCLTI